MLDTFNWICSFQFISINRFCKT